MQETKNRRPVGIAILSWLHIVGGVLGAIMLVVFLPMMRSRPEASEALSLIGIPPSLLLIAMVFLVLLACLSGIGMWTGKWWGWMLGSFYYAYGIVRNVCAIVMISGLLGSLAPEDLAEMARGPAFYYVKYGARIIVHSLLYLYFFKTNVRRYFGRSPKKRWVPALAQFALCILITVVFSVTARVAPRADAGEGDLLALGALFNRGEYQQVIAGASRYVESHPQSYQGWSQLGWAHLRLEQTGEAKACFRKALELEPSWDNAYVGLGVLHRMEGNLAEARANYHKAVSLVPDNAEAFSSLLVLELMDGNDARAVEYGEKAWALRKDSPSIAANLAIAYHYVGDPEKRDAFYRHAEELGYADLAALQEIFNGTVSIR